MKSRKQMLREVGSLYKRVDNVDYNCCAYCKAPRETLDHVPAIATAVRLDLKDFLEKGGKLSLYPSCTKCNNILGAKKLLKYEDRVLYLYNYTNRKLKELGVFWEESELAELGPNLKSLILSHLKEQETLLKRLHSLEETLLSL